MGVLVKQRHLNLYKRYTEQLVDDLGLPVTLVHADVVSQCGNCIYDIVHKCSSGNYNGTGPTSFARGAMCPVCKGAGTIKADRSTTVTCTINYVNLNELDEVTRKAAGDEDTVYVRIKAKVSFYSSIKTASYLIIDGSRMRLINIIKRGLKEKVTCIAYCKQDK